jgi:cytochrome b561
MLMTTTFRYDRTTVILHWTTATLVVLLWLSAQVIDVFPKGVPRTSVRSVHMTMGALLACVLVYRIAWRNFSGVRLPGVGGPYLVLVSRSVHILLYGLLVIEVLLGAANVWARGETWFNLFTVPAFDPSNRALQRRVNGLHDLVANTILVVAGLHAAAALWHHYVRKDDVLRRMLPDRSPQTPTALEPE